MRLYIGNRTSQGVEVTVDGCILDVEISQKLYNHSPTGFEFGYGGSGPSQLALAILQDLYGDVIAKAYYQEFKWDFIAKAEKDGFVISSVDVDIWLKKRLDSH